MPSWVDRSKIQMEDSPDPFGNTDPRPVLSQEFPAHLRRAKLLSMMTPPTFNSNKVSVSKENFKRVKKFCSEEWMRRKLTLEDVGSTITIPGGGGEKLFFRVLSPGWIRARYAYAPDGRLILCFNNSAKIEPDMELYEAHVEKVATK